ncbi:MAG: hypothetical protein C0603_03465 [Denitrovibrio sp.]|nr:MAG: hypothetical protein C0603_03465 [Denitrovibrio sp.]
MKILKPGLKFKILALIMIFISSSALILILSTYIKLRNDIYIKNAEVFQTFTNTFYSEQDIVIKKYSMSLDILFENKLIINAFKQRDRQKLKSYIDDFYNNRLKHFYDIEQFQFHIPPAKSFYRAHAPTKYNDDLSTFRKTVVLANMNKNMVAGIELGRAGLGLRVVKPVWSNYDFLGTVELGGNIEDLLSTPANSTGVEYAVGVYIKSLQKSKFFYHDENKYAYQDMHIYNYSSNLMNTIITSGYMDNENKIIQINEKYYMVNKIPLKDFSAQQIGFIMLSRDTTKEVLAIKRELIKQILIIFSYAIAAISLLTSVLVKLIFNPLEKITKHISSVKTERALPIDPIIIKGDSEITMLAQAYNYLSQKLAESFEQINNQMNEIQIINTSLEKRVQDRTTKLEETNTRLTNALKEIQLSNEAKSEFLASMSHEIRTPMNAVLGLSYLLMQTELTCKQYDYINKIRNSANLLLEIINDVLDFSKIEAGKLELELAPFNLKENLLKLSSMLEISLSKKDVKLIVEIDEKIPQYLVGDSLRITQVINNLGTNATKFTEKGSIKINVKLLTKNDEYAKIIITVVDTGIGIPADKIPILFDSFTQVKRQNQKKIGGSGLGLSISKRILDAMNSDITVESTEGEGSTFTFALTLGIAKQSEIQNIITENQVFLHRRILVCEDTYNTPLDIPSFFRENLADVLSVSSQTDLIKHIGKNIDCDGKLLFDLIVADSKFIDSNFFDSIASVETLNDNIISTPILLVKSSPLIRPQLGDNSNGFKIFEILYSDFYEKIPSLYSQMQNFDDVIQPNLDCFKNSKQSKSDLKVLIVDDNDINLQVITEFAEILGLQYKTARNGYDAIKQLEEEKYNIVFMDIIMPEMDGITATKHIRRSSLNKSTPIYALSASTMPNDIEKCRHAGMSGHIAKPVKIQDITQAINDCIGKTPIASIEQSSEKEDYTLPDPSEYLDTDLGLSYLNGNKKLYHELLFKYFKQYGDIVLKSEEQVSNNASEKNKIFFHTLKGVTRTIGATQLSMASEAIENMIDRGESIKDTHELENFTKAASSLEKIIKEFFADKG